ncbi:MAG: hypothetical protein ACI857_002710, partial [Arenicella sp.]
LVYTHFSMRIIFALPLLCLFSCGTTEGDNEFGLLEETVESATEIDWLSYDEDIFDAAKLQNKLVLLEVGANWCHWCHVMDDSTYANAEVQEYLNENFILSREDQDSRPDLYTAYKPWGWPAIIVQDEDGNDIIRLRGYQERKKFLKILKEVVANPVPLKDEQIFQEEYVASNVLDEQFEARVDHEKGGYPWKNKFLTAAGIIQGLKMNDNQKMRTWTLLTIQQSFLLVDPEWSGVYQYSAKKSWNNQHYEKLLKTQAEYIKAYSIFGSYTQYGAAIVRAEGIKDYCDRFFGNSNPLYWNSQNADLISGVHSEEYFKLSDEKRLQQGIPSVDEKIYLKENALLADALLYLWAATGDAEYFEKADKMLTEILSKYKSGNGLYVREIGKADVFSFEDNRALLDFIMKMYQLSGEDKYLKEAEDLGISIQMNFEMVRGFVSVMGKGKLLQSYVALDNLNAALTFNLLYHLSAKEEFLIVAKTAYQNTDKASLHEKVSYLPLLQMAEEQLAEEPFHAVFLNDGKQKKLGQQLYAQLLLHPSQYFTFEWLSLDEMSAEQEMMYGGLPAGTLFMCTSSYCSAPMYDVESLKTFLKNI